MFTEEEKKADTGVTITPLKLPRYILSRYEMT